VSMSRPASAQVAGVFTGVERPPAAAPVDCSLMACMALTFDDGPSPTFTPQVLDILARHHVRATFFLIGNRVPANEALVRRIYQEGHELGNHSWSHPDMTALAPHQIQQQVQQTQVAIMNAGLPAPTLFRPPYGAINTVVKSRIPLTIAMWNVDPDDWGAKTPAEVIARTMAGAHPGRVVDLHDTSQATAAALDQLVTQLQTQYHLVTFSELFNLEPGQPGLFYGR
jgi:peptidoglycan/xylan/chitin deacetylase (PgdA/CDA1 family)